MTGLLKCVHESAGLHRGQKRMLGLWSWSFRPLGAALCGWWNQQALLTAEPLLQPFKLPAVRLENCEIEKMGIIKGSWKEKEVPHFDVISCWLSVQEIQHNR